MTATLSIHDSTSLGRPSALDSVYRGHIADAVEVALKTSPPESRVEDRTAITQLLFKVFGVDSCQPEG